jgi:predicted small secreted protein
MKLIVVLSMILALTGCGTMGGAMQGAGEDLQRAGEWIRTR